MATIVELTELSELISQVVHELQKERGYTAIFVEPRQVRNLVMS